MLKVFKQVQKDLKELRGAEVRVFGQPTILSNSYDDFTIDILDVLDSLEDYVIDLEDYELDDIEDADDVINALYNNGYIADVNDYKGDNSYNWMAPVSNNFNINVYKDILNGGEFIEFKVHRYGDVRGNYTDSFILHFDNEYEFYEVMSENDIHTTLMVNDKEYYISINIFSDSYEVYDDDGKYIDSAYGDKDDVIECIKEKMEV